MSEDNTNEEISAERLVAMLNDQELLNEYGYRITPKGYMGLVLMELGIPHDLAEELATRMSDKIFLAGWTYIHNDNLSVDFEVPDAGE